MARSWTVLGLVALITASGLYGLTGEEILKQVEQVLTAPQDQVAEAKLALVENDGSQRLREIKLWQKGKEKRLIKFLSPADVKGVGFLVLSEKEMWLWMPAFSKVRRIASHIKRESFMGTDFSYADIGTSEYQENYTPYLERKTDEEYILTLLPREEADIDYGKLRMFVNRSNFVPNKIEFYDQGERLIKVMRNESIERIDGYWTPTRMVMEDQRSGHKTIVELSGIRHDVSLGTGVFTKRNLKRTSEEER